MARSKLRSLAFFLPQFHPTVENDEWWGNGFTEWTNVTRSRPQFDGHQQPRLPKDLGFYDLRVAETRDAQAALARANGIDGFVYYHYWFNGRRVLERPVDEILASQSPDFPFALCWANEDWRRNWDGRSGEVLIEQNYSEEDDRAHIQWLVRAFADPRYIKVNGKPLMLIYRVALLPDPKRTAQIWREEARKAGVGEIHLCYVESMERVAYGPEAIGFDAAVEFAPDWEATGPATMVEGIETHDYNTMAATMMAKPDPGYRRYPAVTPGFDNSPRKNENGYVVTNSTPDAYRAWVSATAQREAEAAGRRGDDALVFVNAWNEWAEGAILEPCSIWGSAYLEAHKAGVEAGVQKTLPDVTVAIVTMGGAAELMRCLQSAIDNCGGKKVEFVVIDNASTDETAAVLNALRADVTSCRNDVAVDMETARRQAEDCASVANVVHATTETVFTAGWATNNLSLSH